VTRLRVLVVHDEASARQTLVPLIEATGLAEVPGVVARVRQAVEVLRDGTADVVLLAPFSLRPCPAQR
jgi:chemotaxis response regulator CheB